MSAAQHASVGALARPLTPTVIGRAGIRIAIAALGALVVATAAAAPLGNPSVSELKD